MATNIKRLTAGMLPKKMIRAQQQSWKYRRLLEDAVLEARGEVNLEDAHLIDIACQHEMTSHVLRWILKNRFEDLTNNEVMLCMERIGRAREARNRAVGRLKLFDGVRDAFYDESTPDVDAHEATETTSEPPNGLDVLDGVSEPHSDT